MDADRWRKLEEVFHAAASLDPEARPAFVRRACHGERALGAEVERLLAAGDRAEGFVADVIREAGGPVEADED